jgi:hypothetical protein
MRQVVNASPFPTNNFITQLRADITQTQGGPTTLTPAGSAAINFSKTGNVVSGNFVDNFTARGERGSARLEVARG